MKFIETVTTFVTRENASPDITHHSLQDIKRFREFKLPLFLRLVLSQTRDLFEDHRSTATHNTRESSNRSLSTT